jgi:Alpha and gamma adaptin binding protein p34
MTTCCSVSVLRVGSSETGLAKVLTEAVTGFLQQPRDDSSTCSENNVVTISNRYFDAAVALVPVSSTTSPAGGKEDGILLVFDDASSLDFNTMAQVHARAESLDQNGDLLRLCIGICTIATTANTTVTSKQQEEEYSRRVLWCLDHGYEYVERVDLSAEGIQQGHNDREKEKFARIIEAIQGTIWSTAKMHAQQKQQLKQSYRQTLENHDVSTTSSTYEPPPTTLLPLTATTTTTTTTSTDKQIDEEEEQAKKALLIQNPMTTPMVPDNPYLKDVPSSNQTLDKQEQDADHIMDSMEGALKEAQRIRELSQKGELTDDERRQRAGDAALVLMNLMNQMGGMDDDDDNDDEQKELSDPEEHDNEKTTNN